MVGDVTANKKLAQQRAQAAKDYLVGKGISDHRVRSTSGEPSGKPSVRFVLGEIPY